MNLRVKVIYRNRKMEPIYENDTPLTDYTDSLSMDMKRILSDVEDLVYLANGNKPKEEWSDEETIAFGKIRCKLLDKSGEISRLPGSIYDGDVGEPPSSFWERILGGKER